jgi:hypothetical protein
MSWMTITPSSGSGNGSIKVTGPIGGSKAKSGKIRLTTANNKTVDITVTQAATALFFTADQDIYSISSSGETIKITGYTNYDTFYYRIDDWSDGTTIDNAITCSILTYDNKTVSYTGGGTITGNPGQIGRSKFTLTVNLNYVNSIEARSTKVEILNSSDTVIETIDIIQDAAESTISASPTSISLDGNGTAQTVNVSSNDSWTATEV